MRQTSVNYCIKKQLFKQFPLTGTKQITQKCNKSKFFSKKLLSNDSIKSYRTEKVSIHKKRSAPKPPSAAIELNISQTTTNKLDQTAAEENDHRVFIENLFDSTLQLQAPSGSKTIENESASSRIKENLKTTTSHKKDNDKTNTTTKGIKC